VRLAHLLSVALAATTIATSAFANNTVSPNGTTLIPYTRGTVFAGPEKPIDPRIDPRTTYGYTRNTLLSNGNAPFPLSGGASATVSVGGTVVTTGPGGTAVIVGKHAARSSLPPADPCESLELFLNSCGKFILQQERLKKGLTGDN
jgi:hypothetical protein